MIKRNYQLLQFLLDLFSLFQLYLLASQIIAFLKEIASFNSLIEGNNAEAVRINPYPVIIIWGGLSAVIYIASLVLPFVFAKKTELNQKQYDFWVYAVLLVRIILLVAMLNLMGEHIHFIIPIAESNPIYVLTDVILIIMIIRITKVRIKKLEPAKKKKDHEIKEG